MMTIPKRLSDAVEMAFKAADDAAEQIGEVAFDEAEDANPFVRYVARTALDHARAALEVMCELQALCDAE
jgi:hypothetical protein